MPHSVRPRPLFLALIAVWSVTLRPTQVFGRNVYLNGVDISNAQNQEVLNVNVQINEQGDIFIVAPHYQVNEENTYLPLSSVKTAKTYGIPKHQKPQELNPIADETKSPEPGTAQIANPPIPVTPSTPRSSMDGDLSPASPQVPGETIKTTPTVLPGGSSTAQPAAPIPKDGQKTSN